MSSKRTSSSKNPAKGEAAAPRMATYFVPGAGIDREVISADICRYLGNDALVRPGNYTDRNTGQESPGFFVTAYRALTTNQLADLKADSARWLAERSAKSAALSASRGPPPEGYVTSQTARQRDYMAETGNPAPSDREYSDNRYAYAAQPPAQSPPAGYGYETVPRYAQPPSAPVAQPYGTPSYAQGYPTYSEQPLNMNFEVRNPAPPQPRAGYPGTTSEYSSERPTQPYGTGTTTAYYQPPNPADRNPAGTSQPDYGPPPGLPRSTMSYDYAAGRGGSAAAPVYETQDDDMDYDEQETVPIAAAAHAAPRRAERERDREPERGDRERERRRHKERR